MDLEHLVKMANQIEANNRAEPDQALAIDNIGSHIRRFWDPRMRKQIVAACEAGDSGLGNLVEQAIRKHLMPVRPPN